MTRGIAVYLEQGAKRTFAAAVDWPGWTRGGRSDDEALDALLAYRPRYVRAMGGAASELPSPDGIAELAVVERVKGDATTDFGAPGAEAKVDAREVDETELERQSKLLRASWRALERAAAAARGKELRKGPRGGGRELPAIIEHVIGAERSYLHQLGGRYTIREGDDLVAHEGPLRQAVLETLRARVAGEELPPQPRRRSPLWPVRYFVRRTAWHALDHAWEIEDRAT